MTAQERINEVMSYSETIRLRKVGFKFPTADEHDEKLSNCCDAEIKNGLCTECGEHCV